MRLSERLEAAVERLYEDGMDTRGIADLFRESAELARAVEDAEVAHVEPKNGLAVMHERCMPLAMIGQRVRLVPEAGQGGGE